MSPEKILEVLSDYRELFEKKAIPKLPFPHDIRFNRDVHLSLADAHCHHMLDKIEQFVKEGRLEKAFRWLGFIQGYMCATEVFTIADLANHNRPPQSEDQKPPSP